MNELEKVEDCRLTGWMRKKGLDVLLMGIDYDGDWEIVNGRVVWGAVTLHGPDGHRMTFLAFQKGDDGSWGGGASFEETERLGEECLRMLGRESGSGGRN